MKSLILAQHSPQTKLVRSKGRWRGMVALVVRSASPAAVLLALPLGAATVGWWRFEEGSPGSPATGTGAILDSSGNGLNGTPSNNPLYSADLPPWAAAVGSTRSLQYNGSSTRVFVPDSPALQLTRSLTIEASFKSEPMVPGTGPTATILIRGDNRPGLDPYSLGLNGGNVLQFQITDANDNAVLLSYPVAFDQWTHAAGTLDDATGEMNLYVNGMLVNSTNTTIRPLAQLDANYSPGLGIGSDETGQYGEYLNGWLDEVRLSDTALSPSEFLFRSSCAPRQAKATPTVVNGFVVGATITDGGCGYTNVPMVIITGGSGSGATASATVSNGVVVSISISDAGINYTNPPTVYIYSPLGLQIGLRKAVKPTFSDLILNTQYQLQLSADLNSWTNQGTPFTATAPSMDYPQYWDVENWGQLFFRLRVLP